MSSGENDDSVRYSYNDKSNVNVSSIEEDDGVNATKCLTNGNQCVKWNEIPSCSNVNVRNTERDRIGSDFIVIMSCDVSDVRDSKTRESVVGANVYDIECDSSSVSADPGQSLVPVANRELVKSESQKLVSLSLSILLAALLQAMRCFAQFLEDIVAPQRL